MALFSKYSHNCADINFSKILKTVERTGMVYSCYIDNGDLKLDQ